MRRYTLILLDIQTLFCQFFLAPTKIINLEFFASYIYSTVCFKKSSPIKKTAHYIRWIKTSWTYSSTNGHIETQYMQSMYTYFGVDISISPSCALKKRIDIHFKKTDASHIHNLN